MSLVEQYQREWAQQRGILWREAAAVARIREYFAESIIEAEIAGIGSSRLDDLWAECWAKRTPERWPED